MRSRALFTQQGVTVAVVDAPSEKQRSPCLSGFRQLADHVVDVQAVIAWSRPRSRTQSHHGFNGIEAEVVGQTVAWMLAK